MQTLTAFAAKQNFYDLISSAQHEPVMINQDDENAVVMMSAKDYQSLEALKKSYLQHCFDAAKQDLKNGNFVDGKEFFENL